MRCPDGPEAARGYVIETGRILFSDMAMATALLSDPKVKNAYLGFE
jgi:ABC-type branched-subunit amino acid transport system ATPase component